MPPPKDPIGNDAKDRKSLLLALQARFVESLLPELEAALRTPAQGQFSPFAITERIREAVAAGFRSLQGPQPRAATDLSSLSMVSEADLDEQLVCSQVADGVLRPNARRLEALRMNLVQALSLGNLQSADAPLSPVFIVNALDAALKGADPDHRHRIDVLRSVEGALAAAMGKAYAECVALLAPTETAQPASSPSGFAERPGPSPVGQSSSVQGIRPDGVLSSHFPKLLESRERGQASRLLVSATLAKSMPTMGSNMLLSILALMQHDFPGDAAAAAPATEPMMQRLRQQVDLTAGKLGMDAAGLALEQPDEETLVQITRLFDALQGDPRFDARACRIFDRLLVPYARMSIEEQGVTGSPAWRLLDTVSEACADNSGQSLQERQLLDRVDATIDRLLAEFNGDSTTFITLERELGVHVSRQRKRSGLAEKRAEQARLGRERLESARAAATGEIRLRRGERALPSVVGEFLDRHVTHHLSQVLLRDGADSPRHAEALQAVDDLLAAFDQGERLPPSTQPQPLSRKALEAVLASSGFMGESASLIIDELEEILAPGSAIVDAATAAAALEAEAFVSEPPVPGATPDSQSGTDAVGDRLPGDSSLDGVESEVKPQPAAERRAAIGFEDAWVPAPEPAISADTEVGDSLDAPPAPAYDPMAAPEADAGRIDATVELSVKTLRVGDWLQLRGASGRMEPAQVSWVSPISSRLLLVNMRGVRVLTASIAELEVLVKLDKLRLSRA